MNQNGSSGASDAGAAGVSVGCRPSRFARESVPVVLAGGSRSAELRRPTRQRVPGQRRRSLLLGACVAAGLVSMGTAPGWAGVSVISNSTTDPNSGPRINSNNNGQVAWTGTSSFQPTVYLWTAGMTKTLGPTTLFDSQPDLCLSNSGDVAYQYQAYAPTGQDFVSGSEIFLWNGTSSSQLSPHTAGEGHIYPAINSTNQLAWVHVYYPTGNQSKLSFDIQFWNGSLNSITTTYVPKTNLHINDSGWVVWQQADAYNQVYLWNGTTVQRLSDGTADSINPQINGNNQVVWQQFDNVAGQQGTNHYQIYLWNGTRTQLTNDSADDTDPQTTVNNQVAWVQHGDPTTGAPSNIFVWNGSATSQVSQNTTYSGDISAPRANGFVAWTQAPSPLTPGTSTVYVWNGGTEIQTISTTAHFAPPELNGLPWMAWMSQDATTGACEVNVYQPDPPTAAPSGLTATPASSSQINLTWVNNCMNATGVNVFRSTAGSGGPFTKIAALLPSATSYSDTGLAASTTYWYELRANNNVGVSGWSNVASATTLAH